MNEENKAAFESAREDLKASFPADHYAVFAGGKIVGAFSTYSEALNKGYSRSGSDPFYVKRIEANEEPLLVVDPIVPE